MTNLIQSRVFTKFKEYSWSKWYFGAASVCIRDGIKYCKKIKSLLKMINVFATSVKYDYYAHELGHSSFKLYYFLLEASKSDTVMCVVRMWFIGWFVRGLTIDCMLELLEKACFQWHDWLAMWGANFGFQIHCNIFITYSIVSNILAIGIPYIANEVDVWGACFEFRLKYMFSLNYCNTPCYIMSYWAIL